MKEEEVNVNKSLEATRGSEKKNENNNRSLYFF
jgi:hypothetical protein